MPASSTPVKELDKDPVDVVDYTFDWSPSLLDDRIASSTWTVPAGIANAGDIFSASTSTIWISGGTAGENYAVYNTITTVNGRTLKRTFQINVLYR